ncbi:MAG: metalloregulator ArsR/SmtB family transcription factor [Candidatus Micrarchaeota archaeon]
MKSSKSRKTRVLKALADEVRLALLEKISESEICACELPRFVNVSQPAVSQHLKTLREAGLVETRKDGVKRLYSISNKGETVLNDVSRW